MRNLLLYVADDMKLHKAWRGDLYWTCSRQPSGAISGVSQVALPIG